MSTNPYPDVNGDESGIVPPQGGRSSEWPKKIRTLTAAELDRLTIDRDGRFYWDGKPVAFEPPPAPPAPPAPAAPPAPQVAPAQEATPVFSERSALEILERAALEIGDRKAPERFESGEVAPPVEPSPARTPAKAAELDVAAPAAPAAAATPRSEIVASMEDRPAMIAPTIRTTERVRLSLSFWQSLGIILMLLSVLAGAWGIAALGLVTAHDWACRIGVVNHYCPPPAVKPPVRSDIPA